MWLPTIGIYLGIPLDNVIRSMKTCSLSLHRNEDAHDALGYCCNSPTPHSISALRALRNAFNKLMLSLHTTFPWFTLH